MQVLTAQTETSGRNGCSQSLFAKTVCWARHFAGVSQSGRVARLKRRTGRQLRTSSTLTLHPKKAGLRAIIPPEATIATGLSSFAKPVSLCPASIHTLRPGCNAPTLALWGLQRCPALLDLHLGE